MCRPPPAKTRRPTQPPWWNEELEALWVAKRKALKQHQRQSGNRELHELAKTASNTFKQEALKAKSDKYESFCKEVTADKALIKFWNLYGSMQNKKKSKSIPDFTDDNGVWMSTDCEKGEALFERYRKQTDQENEQERLTFVRRLRAHYEDDPSPLQKCWMFPTAWDFPTQRGKV